MKMVFQNLKADDITGSLQVDFSDVGSRFIIKLLHENPDLIQCLYANLLHYEKFAGYNPDVKVDARTDAFLQKVMKK